MPVLPRDRARQHRADRAIGVADLVREPHGSLSLDGRRRRGDQLVIERAGEAVILRFAVAASHVGRHRRLVEDPREIESARLPVVDAAPHVEEIGPADQVLELAHAELRHQLAHFLGHEEEIVDDMLGLSREFPAQLRILRRDADRARVEVALPHHDAALDDERRRREAELVGAEHRADDDVAAGLDLAVHLHRDAAAEPVQHQRLLRLGETQLPRRARVLDRRFGRGARAAVVAGDRHVVRLGLGHAGRDGAHADFGHELHRDRRLRIRVLEVVDQLREILDRVDVVVRRRRNETDPGHRVTELRDVARDLVAGQLAAFARFRALRDLDLELIRIDEIFGGHPEAGRGHLLDPGAQRVAFLAAECR